METTRDSESRLETYPRLAIFFIIVPAFALLGFIIWLCVGKRTELERTPTQVENNLYYAAIGIDVIQCLTCLLFAYMSQMADGDQRDNIARAACGGNAIMFPLIVSLCWVGALLDPQDNLYKDSEAVQLALPLISLFMLFCVTMSFELCIGINIEYSSLVAPMFVILEWANEDYSRAPYWVYPFMLAFNCISQFFIIIWFTMEYLIVSDSGTHYVNESRRSIVPMDMTTTLWRSGLEVVIIHIPNIIIRSYLQQQGGLNMALMVYSCLCIVDIAILLVRARYKYDSGSWKSFFADLDLDIYHPR